MLRSIDRYLRIVLGNGQASPGSPSKLKKRTESKRGDVRRGAGRVRLVFLVLHRNLEMR